MTERNDPHDAHGQPVHGHDGHEAHGDKHYIKIYGILLVLLVISILGPEIGIKWLTLITAFGIAFVKAGLVIKNFMHLNVEKVVAKWVLAASLMLVALFFFGVAPDVMKHSGSRWVNDAAIATVARGIPLEGEEHGEGEGDPEHAEGEEVPTPATTPAPAEFVAAQAYGTTCALCHGATGAGDGPGGAALDPKPANFTDPAFWEGATDASMFAVIKNGGAANGLSPLMAAWGSLYTDEQITQLVEHIKTFR